MPRKPPEAAATREIVLDGQAVAYRLRRSQRRTIGLAVDHRGLTVGAPAQARIGDIETLIRQHGAWVLDKLATWRERPPAPQLTARHGDTLQVFGEPLTLALRPATRNGWHIEGSTLHLAVTVAVDPEKVLKIALREHARQVFAARLAHHAPRLGVTPPPLRLSSARTRWGSCSARGGIALNWRLVFLPLAIVDYVVCHELAHLREMNHSPRFWSVVEQLCPNFKELRRELRAQSNALPITW